MQRLLISTRNLISGSLQEDELRKSKDAIATLTKQNNELVHQLEILAYEDATVTKDGITPLMKSIMLGTLTLL